MENYLLNTPYDYVKVSVSKSKQSNPDYATRIANKIPLADLPYDLVFDRAMSTSMKTYLVKFKNGQEISEQLVGQFATGIKDNNLAYQRLQADLSNQMDEAIALKDNKLLSKIKATSLPILMLYKERKETGNLILGFLQKGIDFAHHAKRRRWRDALKVYNVHMRSKPARRLMRKLRRAELTGTEVGNIWLQARFAWLPLYKDIEDSLNAAAKSEEKFNTFKQRVGLKFNYTAKYNDGKHDTDYTANRVGAFTMVVRYAISDHTLAAASSFMNVPAFLWDGVPYSFVIDRVVDVSTYLDLYDATIGTQFTTGSKTIFYEDMIVSYPPGKHNFRPDIETYMQNGECYRTKGIPPTRTNVRMTRTVLTSFPKPRLEFPMRNSLVQSADIGFLALQLKKKFAQRL